MKRIALFTSLTLALTSLLPTPAQAQEIQTTFETVDSFNHGHNLGPNQQYFGFEVTGIVQGETTPRTVFTHINVIFTSVESAGRSCERMALLAQSKPGQYLLRVRHEDLTPYNLLGCSLTRVTP
jgi:hypothetical protein